MYRVFNNSKLARIYLYFETLPSGIGESVARCDGQGSEILKGERQLGAAALSPSALRSSSRNAYLLVLVYSTVPHNLRSSSCGVEGKHEEETCRMEQL
jgi:hypothetical protein